MLIAVPVLPKAVTVSAYPTALTKLPVVTAADRASKLVEEGATPAPPPITKLLAAKAPEDARVPEAVYANTPPEVPEVRPVPPLATGRVPVTPLVKLTASFEAIFTKSDPFQATQAFFPAGIVTPVVADPLTTTAPSDWLITK
jgi:hypothetical protein